jgi:glutamyl-tRNA reductase
VTQTGDNHLLLLGSNHETAPLEIRETFALEADKVGEFYRELKAISGVRECLVVSTCNRIEVYGVGESKSVESALETAICSFNGFEGNDFSRYGFRKAGRDAVRHFFEVSAGIRSQMVGETEIFGQVKDAYTRAVERRAVGPVLHRVVQKSFQAAKWVRTQTDVGRGQVSIGNVAVNLAVRIFGDLKPSRVLVVGTGEVGEKTAKAFASRGVGEIAVTSRTAGRAEALADETGGRAVPFESWVEELSGRDIAVCSTAAHRILLDVASVRTAMRSRPRRPLFIIDLAMPRNVDAGIVNIPNVFLYNLDDLSEIANENLRARESEVERCRGFLASRADRLWDAVSR